jgi:AcrR family transcriptional regulator
MTQTTTGELVPGIGVKPMRADACRNRQSVMEAAREVFAEQGRDAQMTDIASHAGVGVGTVYRHFPTKEALIEAIAADKFEDLSEKGEQALANPEPWESFRDFLHYGASLQARDRAFSEVVSANPYPVAEEEGARLRDVSTKLLRRAQEAGAVREDVKPEDIPMIMCGLGHTLRFQPDPNAWERYIEVILDGLRAKP